MIVVGLGNPGKQYIGTRHNVGFEITERVVERMNGTPWKDELGVAWSKVGPHIVIQPREFMNLSGPSLRRFLQYKKLVPNQTELPNHLLVVHDDLDFPLGEIHEQRDRSAAGHNGVQSIIDAFGTKNFVRLRIGIGSNHDQGVPAEDYVLQKFSADELRVLSEAVAQTVDMIRQKLG